MNLSTDALTSFLNDMLLCNYDMTHDEIAAFIPTAKELAELSELKAMNDRGFNRGQFISKRVAEIVKGK